MKSALRIFLILSIIMTGYGYWGAFTKSGNRQYDEMDGYFPFFIFIGGLILLVLFFVLLIIMKRKKK